MLDNFRPVRVPKRSKVFWLVEVCINFGHNHHLALTVLFPAYRALGQAAFQGASLKYDAGDICVTYTSYCPVIRNETTGTRHIP